MNGSVNLTGLIATAATPPNIDSKTNIKPGPKDTPPPPNPSFVPKTSLESRTPVQVQTDTNSPEISPDRAQPAPRKTTGPNAGDTLRSIHAIQQATVKKNKGAVLPDALQEAIKSVPGARVKKANILFGDSNAITYKGVTMSIQDGQVVASGKGNVRKIVQEFLIQLKNNQKTETAGNANADLGIKVDPTTGKCTVGGMELEFPIPQADVVQCVIDKHGNVTFSPSELQKQGSTTQLAAANVNAFLTSVPALQGPADAFASMQQIDPKTPTYQIQCPITPNIVNDILDKISPRNVETTIEHQIKGAIEGNSLARAVQTGLKDGQNLEQLVYEKAIEDLKEAGIQNPEQLLHTMTLLATIDPQGMGKLYQQITGQELSSQQIQIVKEVINNITSFDSLPALEQATGRPILISNEDNEIIGQSRDYDPANDGLSNHEPLILQKTVSEDEPVSYQCINDNDANSFGSAVNSWIHKSPLDLSNIIDGNFAIPSINDGEWSNNQNNGNCMLYALHQANILQGGYRDFQGIGNLRNLMAPHAAEALATACNTANLDAQVLWCAVQNIDISGPTSTAALANTNLDTIVAAYNSAVAENEQIELSDENRGPIMAAITSALELKTVTTDQAYLSTNNLQYAAKALGRPILLANADSNTTSPFKITGYTLYLPDGKNVAFNADENGKITANNDLTTHARSLREALFIARTPTHYVAADSFAAMEIQSSNESPIQGGPQAIRDNLLEAIMPPDLNLNELFDVDYTQPNQD